MKLTLENNLSEIKLDILQRLTKEEDKLKAVDLFFDLIVCKDKDSFADYDRALLFNKWSKASEISIEESPLKFSIGGRTFHSHYLDLGEHKIPTLLNMQLAFLIELTNLEIEYETYRAFDNVAALMYREDWTKPFDQKEYLSNALFFNQQKSKYSIWGVQKMQELYMAMREAFPILYDGDQENGRTDGRKMMDLLNIASGDNPSKWNDARNTSIADVFGWMEEKKIEHINKKLKER